MQKNSFEHQVMAIILYCLGGEVEIDMERFEELLNREMTIMQTFAPDQKTIKFFIKDGLHVIDCHLHDGKDICARCNLNV